MKSCCCCCKCLRKYFCCCIGKGKNAKRCSASANDKIHQASNDRYEKREKEDVNANVAVTKGKHTTVTVTIGDYKGGDRDAGEQITPVGKVNFGYHVESKENKQNLNIQLKDIAKESYGIELQDTASLTGSTTQQDIFLNAHNKLRSRHNAPVLEWNDSLTRQAQKWADHLTSTGRFKHDDAKGFGENLFTKWSSGDLSTVEATKDAVESWYDEMEDYNFSQPGFSSSTGHFTQVVWKESKEIGFGISKRNKNGGTEIIIVGRYLPPGNMSTKFKENVLPPGQLKKQIFVSNTNGNNKTETIGNNRDATDGNKHTTGRNSRKKEFDTFIRTHNEFRKKHKSPALVWNDDLSHQAQQWAKRLASTGKFEHDSGKGYGENLFNQWSSNDVNVEEACRKAVEKWYGEIADYAFSRPGFQKGTGHFTQVVWKASKELGLGYSKHSKNGGTEVIVVGRYLPAGNFLSKFPENVLPA